MLLDLHFSVSNDIVSTKIYDKYGGFDYEIVSFPILDGDVTLHHMEFIFVNLSDLLEHLVMLQTSTLVKIFNFINFLNKPICIINFANVFLSCIADALT